jgi:hypothetical protein
MKVARAVIILALCRSLLILDVHSRPQGQTIDVDALGDHLFMGQAYPSGNVYLRPFSGNPKTKSFWPDELSLISIGGIRPGVSSIRLAVRERVLASRTENGVVKSVYIPGAEGMDESHLSCGLGDIIPESPSQQLISRDFFRAMFDHCEPNDGVGLYRTSGSNYSVMIIAVANNISLANHEVILDGRPRPLMVAEREEISREKSAAAKNQAQLECTSNPSYLDAAVEIFQASIEERNLTLRVSTYDNPGCAGHLASIYILDVLRNGEMVKKFEFLQYQGPL